MKTPHALVLVFLAVAVTLVIEETRIAALRKRPQVTQAADSRPAAAANPLRAQDEAFTALEAESASTSAEPSIGPEPVPAKAEDEDFGKVMRKMWENPAGKAMMNQGVKMAVAMMYGDFIDGLDLTKEEEDYFSSLLGAEMAEQQELGMKFMSASEEEQKQMMEGLRERQKKQNEDIKTFLNSEEDYKSFVAFKERLPERQQMEGIRAVMASKDAALDAGTEPKLLEAMHRARLGANTRDLSGTEGYEALAQGNITSVFEEDWQKQQAALRNEVTGILNEKQQEAFFEYQQQMLELQRISLKMAEQMMKPKENGAPMPAPAITIEETEESTD